MNDLGFLQRSDPLYGFIREKIQRGLGLSGSRDYRVFQMRASNQVYLYEDTHTRRRLIGKFYGSDAPMEREFANLTEMRARGFDGSSCHYIARPLGKSPALGNLLLEEFCYGETLTSIIQRAIRGALPGLLFSKLTALAWFLNAFHSRTTKPECRVDFQPVTNYAHSLLDTLHNRSWISDHRRGKMKELLSLWQSRPVMTADSQVTVHGDATPENFLFGDGMHVISFDLERMRRADRLFDLGRLVAELAHFFLLETGDRFRAEPFIGHFLWEYCCHFPDREAAFRPIVQKVPFYMGINLLRIARNSYFSWDYRQKLLNAASECLKGGLL